MRIIKFNCKKPKCNSRLRQNHQRIGMYLLMVVAAGTVTSHLSIAPWSEIAFQMAFQGGGSVVISGISFTRMIQHYGPVRSTMITALVPGLSAVGAVVFLDEPMHWNLVAGLLLVTAGILVGVLRKSQAPAAAAKAAS